MLLVKVLLGGAAVLAALAATRKKKVPSSAGAVEDDDDDDEAAEESDTDDGVPSDDETGVPATGTTDTIPGQGGPAVVPPGVDLGPDAPTKPDATATDWVAWIHNKVIAGVQSESAAACEAAANEIEDKLPSLTGDARSLALQAIAALRAEAQSLRADSLAAKATPPPIVVPGLRLPPPPEPPPPPVKPPPAVPPVAPAATPAQVSAAEAAAAVELARRKAVAAALDAHLDALVAKWGLPGARNKEDKAQVTAYQRQEGLTADGLYGVGTGLSLIKYGLIPSKPFYFSKDPKKTAEAKARWLKTITDMAASDPARSAQWLAVADVRYL